MAAIHEAFASRETENLLDGGTQPDFGLAVLRHRHIEDAFKSAEEVGRGVNVREALESGTRRSEGSRQAVRRFDDFGYRSASFPRITGRITKNQT